MTVYLLTARLTARLTTRLSLAPPPPPPPSPPPPSPQLAKAATWAPAGHEVAFDQSVLEVTGLRPGPTAGPARPGPAAVRVLEGAGGLIGIEGGGFRLEFCRTRAGLVRWTVRGRELLAGGGEGPGGGGGAGLLPNLWRCPTDNDQGGIDVVIGTKAPQRWSAASGCGDGEPRVRFFLLFDRPFHHRMEPVLTV